MRVRLKVSLTGTRNGQEWPPMGAEMDLPDNEGAEMCANGMAEPVTTFERAEKAVVAEKAEVREVLVPKRGPGRPRGR